MVYKYLSLNYICVLWRIYMETIKIWENKIVARLYGILLKLCAKNWAQKIEEAPTEKVWALTTTKKDFRWQVIWFTEVFKKICMSPKIYNDF